MVDCMCGGAGEALDSWGLAKVVFVWDK